MALALWLTAAWKAYQSIGRPDSRGIRLLALFCAFAGSTVTVWSSPDLVDSLLTPALGPSPSAFLRNILPIPGLYAALMFLFYSAARDDDSGMRFWRIQLPLAVWACMSVPLWYLTPPEHRADGLTDVANIGHVLFFGVTLLGLGYSFGPVGTPLVARLARQAPDRASGRGLYVAAGGFVVMFLVFIATRMVALLIAVTGNRPSAIFEHLSVVGQLSGLSIIIVGFGFPILRAKVIAGRLWARHLRLARRIRPLWDRLDELSQSYDLMRESQSTLFPLKVHHRFYRRVIECRDGLVLVGRIASTDGPPKTLEDEAGLVLSVLANHAVVKNPVKPGPPGLTLGAPTGANPTVEDDAEALAALAQKVGDRQRRAHVAYHVI